MSKRFIECLRECHRGDDNHGSEHDPCRIASYVAGLHQPKTAADVACAACDAIHDSVNQADIDASPETAREP